MAKGLIFAAHHAIAQAGFAIAGHHRRDDGVEWPLATLDPVRMGRIDDKALAAVVKHHAALGRHDA